MTTQNMLGIAWRHCLQVAHTPNVYPRPHHHFRPGVPNAAALQAHYQQLMMQSQLLQQQAQAQMMAAQGNPQQLMMIQQQFMMQQQMLAVQIQQVRVAIEV